MARPIFTRYEADALVQARKVAGKIRSVGHENSPLLIDIRKVDSPDIALRLDFEARTPRKGLTGVADVRRPSASLIWMGRRIRGIDWTIKHEVTQKGVPTGEVVKGWHEHYWTDEDGSNSIRVPRPYPKNEDVSALINWCSTTWNITGIGSMGLFT
jgi:hypothetical protein